MESDRIKEIADVIEAMERTKAETEAQKINQIKLDEKMTFKEWFFYHWAREEGLINQKTASKILGVSPARIIQLKKSGRLKEIQYPKDTQKYISLKQLKKVLEFYEFKREFKYEV